MFLVPSGQGIGIFCAKEQPANSSYFLHVKLN
jgi:hypothetical protein